MNRIVLAEGDLILATRGKETLLYPVAPIDGGPIRLRGHYPNWGRAQWERLLHHARRLSPMYPGLEESLRGVESRIRKARIEKELPVVNEDRAKSPAFRAVHSLVLAHSRARGRITIRGRTWPHARELMSMGFGWNGKRWTAGHSKERLRVL